MNITDSPLKTSFNTTNSKLLTDPTIQLNITTQTELLTSAISASGSATYSLGLFFGLGAALIGGTFVLPVITGPIIRLTLQSMDRHRAYWRLLYPILLSLYVLAIYILFPILLRKKIVFFIPELPEIDDLGDPYFDYFDNSYLDSWDLYSTLSYVILGFQLLLPAIAFFSIFQGRGPFRWFKGRGDKRSILSILKRFFFVSFSTLCAVFGVFFGDSGYLGIIINFLPVLLLLWIWAGSSIRRFCVRKWRAVWQHKIE